MATTPEGKVKAAVQKRLEYYGVLPFTKAADAVGPVNGVYWMPVQGPYAVHGVHDFVGNWGGLFWTIETKAPENPEDATSNQLAFQQANLRVGGISMVGVRDASAVDELYRIVQSRLQQYRTAFTGATS